MLRPRRVGAPLLLAGLAACGGRTTTAEDASVDATDAGAPRDAGCVWRVAGPATRVSVDPMVPGDVSLASAVATDAGVLVAWRTPSDLMTPQTVVTRLVAFDGVPQGGARVVLQGAGASSFLQGISLAAGVGRVAISVTDQLRGCLVRPLTGDGAPDGPEVEVRPAPSCGDLAATPSGYEVLSIEAAPGPRDRLLVYPLLGDGQRGGSAKLLLETAPDQRLFDLGWTRRSDGGFFLAARTGDSQGSVLSVRSYDAAGAPLAEAATFASSLDWSFSLSLAPTASGVVAAWATRSPPAVERVTLNASGGVVRPLGVAATTRESVTALHLASDGAGRALLAWVDHGGQSDTAAFVRPLDEAGDVAGEPIPITAPGGAFGPSVRVVASRGRALVLVESFGLGVPHRVHAVPMRCGP